MSKSITLDDLNTDISHLTTEDDQPMDNLRAKPGSDGFCREVITEWD